MSAPAGNGSGRGARPIYFTPFGLYSRYMLGAYLRHTVMVAAALMTIALTIDLLPQVSLFSGNPLHVMWSIVRLAALRLSDLLPPFIPFATFLGVVWSESAFTESRERLLIWNSGRSPLLCLAPALFAGLLMGAFLFAIDAWLRPVAIHVQMAEVLGREGIRLDRGKSGGTHWIALPDGLLKAEIQYGPPLELHDATIYKLDTDGHLAEVDTAAMAAPAGNGVWRLTDGHYWRADFADQGRVLTTGAHEENEIPFKTRTIVMNLDELWLSNLGLSPQYLSLSDLRRLAHAQIMSRDLSGYKTRLQTVFGETLFTCLMAFLAATLSMLYFAFATRWFALVAVLLAGYLAHFASKAFSLMGEFGYIPPLVAGWLAPLLLIAAVGCALFVIQKKRGLGVKLEDTPHFQN
ncbi:MAG TPA: LptF/LptG family permease [Rhizomicrobium sp.]|jgi:lipopolysaccharide export LptBFGC system permease protein LptF|nr:LptF/LptG family permease [Rhizomicrobium sp.]